MEVMNKITYLPNTVAKPSHLMLSKIKINLRTLLAFLICKFYFTINLNQPLYYKTFHFPKAQFISPLLSKSEPCKYLYTCFYFKLFQPKLDP